MTKIKTSKTKTKAPPVGNQTKSYGFNGTRTITRNLGRRVKVTDQHFEDAIRNNSGHCAIGNAVEDSIPGASRVTVDLQTIRWSDPVRRLRYMALTPRSAQCALINWDQGLRPAAFSFNIRHAQIAHMRGTRFSRNEGTEPLKSHKHVRSRHVPKKGSKLLLKPNGDYDVRPVKLGGKMPPRMGLRRAFGLRAFTLGEGTVVPAFADVKLNKENKK
jgi:hypothetical protein